MARHWIGGTGNWNDTAHWSDLNGGSGGFSIPIATDDVFFDSGSFSGAGQVVTINVAAVCNNMDWTGATNTPTLAGSQNLTISGSLTFIVGMLLTYTGLITFASTIIGCLVTFAGLTLLGQVLFSGIGGGWTLNDAVTQTKTGSNAFKLSGGTLDMGASFTHTFAGGFTVQSFFGSPCTISMNNCTLVFQSNGDNCFFGGAAGTLATINSNTSILKMTGVNITPTFSISDMKGASLLLQPTSGSTYNLIQGQGSIFKDLTFIGPNSISMVLVTAFNFTFTGTVTITGFSIGTRIRFASSVRGTSHSISAGLWVNSNVDFEDIAATGPGMTNTDTTGDLGGNTGTFVPRLPRTLYWFKDTGSYSNTALWDSSGVADAATIPLPQDTARFDPNSFSAGSNVVTFDVVRIGSVDWTGSTNTPRMTWTIALSVYGSWTMIAAMLATQSAVVSLLGRGVFTFTSAGLFSTGWTLDAITGSITLQDKLITGSGNFSVTSGIFNSGNNLIISQTFISGGIAPRTINLGSSIVLLVGAGSVINFSNSVALVFNAGTSQIILSATTAKIIAPGLDGVAFYDIIDSNTGGGGLTLQKSSTFHSLKSVGSTKTITFTAGTTQTFTGPSGFLTGRYNQVQTCVSSVNGVAYNVIANGNLQVSDYLSLRDCHADVNGLWYAGANSTNVSGNTNWRFTSHRRGALGRTVVAQGARTPKAQASRTVVAQGTRTVAPA